ncbi:MAG: hypothetical protein A2087_03360 [Spirochaetes bacterium GWD1_61_31]|nr:MAG: hypothetical protein A2Y37_05410 [Spirochaetes bacterium GWB1_60_80]OHD38621.1 MAG: hypothetical protein A2087_03360 [Spirochaetes bacterium GWD1_61_31]OHD43161.1 MAG: hypothetical protein A2Y35_01215 [Spirochaetes bacterium GWE1_60_18]OHD58736.1 MAG: hypothetical protein A2Y32_01700 [Spirochaetes bacterium GWF1_60_12]
MERKMKHFRFLSSLLGLGLLLASLAPLSAQTTRLFTDSAGRTVVLPRTLDRIAPSGPLAQIVLYSLAPESVIGWSSRLPQTVRAYMPARHWEKPLFGQFYGTGSATNLEALIAAAPQVIIDIGEAKPSIREDMDTLQHQTGIPVIFIEATLPTLAQAYRTLGELTGLPQEAEALAVFCERTLQTAAAISAAAAARPRSVYYGEGETGLNTNPAGSVHADVIPVVGARNVAEIPLGRGSGGNTISIEQLMLWNPDVIILGPGSVYDSVRADPLWRDLAAVQAGRVYEIPTGPYNWMGRPPAANRLIGIYWLAAIVYPEHFREELAAVAREFYDLFYHYELSAEEISQLLSRSAGLR